MHLIKYILLSVSLLSPSVRSFTQGCSDAGACSLSFNHKSQMNIDSAYKNTFTLGNVSGLGDQNVFINSAYLQLAHQFSRHFNGEIKITSGFINGDLSTHFNAGDIYLKGTYGGLKIVNADMGFLVAAKVPLNNSNIRRNQVSLPMVYQTSLGTFDAIVGYQARWRGFEFFNILQMPLKQNQNGYFSSYTPYTFFPSTNKFIRKPDIIFSAAYKHLFNESRILLGGQVLGIYHLANDTYTNENNEQKAIEGSQGLTLNLNAITGYRINKKNYLELSAATPVKVRQIRPDGLTRKFTLDINYKYSF